MAEGRLILTGEEMRRALTRIAHEVVESNKGLDGLTLVGIRRRGVPLARRIAEQARETALAVLAGGTEVDVRVIDRSGRVIGAAGVDRS